MNFLLYYLNEVMLFSENRFFITVLIYFFFLFLYSVFSIPGLVIFIALSGYLFGIYYSYLISIIAISLGSLVFFLFSKFFLNIFFCVIIKNIHKILINIFQNQLLNILLFLE